MNPEDCRQFLSSPQSYDYIEKIKTKKVIKKKRKTIHKHLLNTNILLENDPLKLTMRQRILHQKFQNKKDTMGDLDLISSGLEVNSYGKNNKIKEGEYKIKLPVQPEIKESKYKIKIPVYTKIRLECDKENFIEDAFIYNEINGIEYYEIENDDIIIDNINNDNIINDSNIVINKNNNIEINDINEVNVLQSKKKHTQLSLYINNHICLYKIFHSPLFIPTHKITLKDCDILKSNESIKIEFHELKEYKTEISEKIKYLNFNNKPTSVNKQMLHKKRRILFQDSSKKKKEACIYNAAYYITILENILKEKEYIIKKCEYYTDVLIKAFKQSGCVCKVVGEVKWFINQVNRN